MALEVNLETNGTALDWEVVKSIAGEFDFEPDPAVPGTSNSFFGTLRDRMVYVSALWGGEYGEGPRGIIAEGKHGCDFEVNGEMIFRYYGDTYDESVAAIKNFLERISQRTGMQFVLSFQYEGVRAIRDLKRGFEWFWYESR